jgi:hypothetical protein
VGSCPEFLRFPEQLKGWVDGPPVIEHLDVVGSYNLFGTSTRNPPFDRQGDLSKGHATGALGASRPGDAGLCVICFNALQQPPW